MSQVYIIRCISCKDEFDQGDSYKRICEKCVINRRKSREKINNAKKRPVKRQPTLYTKQCLACDNTFTTKNINKQFCFHYCFIQYKHFPTRLINTEKKIIRLEKKIEQVNIESEAKIINIVKQLEKTNYTLESQRLAYEAKLEFLRSKI